MADLALGVAHDLADSEAVGDVASGAEVIGANLVVVAQQAQNVRAEAALYELPDFDPTAFAKTVRMSAAGQTIEGFAKELADQDWGQNFSTALGVAGNLAEEAGLVAVTVGTGCFYFLAAAAKDFPVIKLEIFRDFYQILGSFFTNLGLSSALEGAKGFFGNMSTVIAMDWAYTFKIPMTVMLAILLALAIVCLVLSGVLMVTTFSAKKGMDAIRDGNEAESWSDRGRWRRRFIYVLVNVLITIYMPVSQAALKVLTCHPQYVVSWESLWQASSPNKGTVCKIECRPEMSDLIKAVACNSAYDLANNVPPYFPGFDGYWDCSKCYGIHNGGLALVLAGVTIIFITTIFPTFIYRIIQTSKPIGTKENHDICYDEDGKE